MYKLLFGLVFAAAFFTAQGVSVAQAETFNGSFETHAEANAAIERECASPAKADKGDFGETITVVCEKKAAAAAAAGGGEGVAKSVGLQNPLKAKSITEFLLNIIEVILVFATPIIVFFIILAGFQYVIARGNPTKIETASRALLYAVIGGVLILGAFVILEVIKGTVDAFLR